MKYKFALFLTIAGIVMFIFALNIFKNGTVEQFLPVVVIAAMLSFSSILLSGIEIGEQRSELNGQAVKVKDLKVGTYEVVSNGFLDSLHCSQTDRCSVKFLVLERQETEFLVEINISERLDIEKILGEIKRGTPFKINKKGQIEKI